MEVRVTRPALGACLSWIAVHLRHDLLFVIEDMIRTWAPDDFWQVAQPLIPTPARRPQGGGKRRADDRAVLAAVVYLVQAGCSWWKLPAQMFGISRATAHRRFAEWTAAGLWERLHHAFLNQLGEAAAIAWSRAVVDSISVRAEKGAI
jgi:transposase